MIIQSLPTAQMSTIIPSYPPRIDGIAIIQDGPNAKIVVKVVDE
jgi:hypothetical protein